MPKKPNIDLAEEILLCIHKNSKKKHLSVYEISRIIQRPYATVYWYVKGIGTAGGLLKPAVDCINMGGLHKKDSHPAICICKIREKDDEGKNINISKFISQLRLDYEQ